MKHTVPVHHHYFCSVRLLFIILLLVSRVHCQAEGTVADIEVARNPNRDHHCPRHRHHSPHNGKHTLGWRGETATEQENDAQEKGANVSLGRLNRRNIFALPRSWRRRKQLPVAGNQDTAANPSTSSPTPPIPPATRKKSRTLLYSPFRMYMTCLTIVTIWITTGTLFYSFCNKWPIPQSFFYAVDAGLSIGFCTDVAETKLVSKAFTIVYILLGASVVGGALALFIQDAIEGIHANQHDTKEYQLLLEQSVFEKYNVSRSGSLNIEEFKQLLHASTDQPLSEMDIEILWTKFDRLKDGVIHFEEFAGTYRGIEQLIASLHDTKKNASNYTNCKSLTHWTPRWLTAFFQWLWNGENRIYFVFVMWVLLGIIWGIFDQGWDPITATHFAVSALATGGLTAPSVNSEGILPAEPAIFCGLYCLLGIPLMAVTLGHFARVLVAGHIKDMEEYALTRPMTATEYNVAKENLAVRTSHTGSGLYLGDFVVLQLMRQGKLSVETFNILKKEFEILDKDKTGILTLYEATNWNIKRNEGTEADIDASYESKFV